MLHAQQQDQADRERIAQEEAVDRLPHRRRILLDVEEEKHDQLAGEQDGRAGRKQPDRHRDVEYAGQIGLEKMHHAERAHEDADADLPAQPEHQRHRAEIEQRLHEEQNAVRHFPDPPFSVAGALPGRRFLFDMKSLTARFAA